jgi:hypothetical protein
LKFGKYHMIQAAEEVKEDDDLILGFCCVATQKCTAEKCFKMTCWDMDSISHFLSEAKTAVADGTEFSWKMPTLGASDGAQKAQFRIEWQFAVIGETTYGSFSVKADEPKNRKQVTEHFKDFVRFGMHSSH